MDPDYSQSPAARYMREYRARRKHTYPDPRNSALQARSKEQAAAADALLGRIAAARKELA